jgi:hypothetical protein
MWLMGLSSQGAPVVTLGNNKVLQLWLLWLHLWMCQQCFLSLLHGSGRTREHPVKEPSVAHGVCQHEQCMPVPVFSASV